MPSEPTRDLADIASPDAMTEEASVEALREGLRHPPAEVDAAYARRGARARELRAATAKTQKAPGSPDAS